MQIEFEDGEYADKIIWSAGNSDILLVENGTVVALSAGVTNVIAKTYNGVVSKCRVTVRA